MVEKITSFKMFTFFVFLVTIHAVSPDNVAETLELITPEDSVRIESNAAEFTLSCYVEGINASSAEYWWEKISPNEQNLTRFTTVVELNETRFEIRLTFENVKGEMNGTYRCNVMDTWNDIPRVQNQTVSLVVIERPRIELTLVKSIFVDWIYLEWNVSNGTCDIETYRITYTNGNNTTKLPILYTYPKGLRVGSSSKILNVSSLEKGGIYNFTIEAACSNLYWVSATYKDEITLLEEDFVPELRMINATDNSLTISWTKRLQDEDLFIYNVTGIHRQNKTIEYFRRSVTQSNSLTIDELAPDVSYWYKVRSCSITNTQLCGDWSNQITRIIEMVESDTQDSVAPKTPRINVATLIIIAFYYYLRNNDFSEILSVWDCQS